MKKEMIIIIVLSFYAFGATYFAIKNKSQELMTDSQFLHDTADWVMPPWRSMPVKDALSQWNHYHKDCQINGNDNMHDAAKQVWSCYTSSGLLKEWI